MATFNLLGVIDDEGYQEVKQLEGRDIRVEQWNQEASWDSMRHYSLGLGDDNPLFCDPAYGEESPFGTIIAPPTFPFTAFDGAIGAGLPGVQPMYAGTEWQFFRRIRRNEALRVTATFGPVKRTSGRMAPDMVIQSAISEYTSGDGEPVARAVAYTFRVPRRGSNDGLAYEARDEHEYTESELEEIGTAAASEWRRGPGQPTDAAVGDELPAVVKGPLGRIDMTAYYAGLPGSPGYKSCEMAWKYRKWARQDPERLPSNYDPSYFSERVLPSIGHQDAGAARELGMPNAYNNGPQRVGWFAHCLTNWMGDGAFLRTLNVRLERPEIFGDTIWIRGEVTDRTDDAPVPRLDISLVATNQLNERTALATAVVELDDYGRGSVGR